MRDKDVRVAVKRELAKRYAGDHSTRVVEEMGVWSGSVRIDIAVINGELLGYELKSEHDTLERLPLQSKIYSYVFDRLTLVVGAKHAQKASKLIPGWWGLTVATLDNGNVKLHLEKTPNLNPNPDPYLVAQLLWKEEAISILEKFDLARGWRSKRVKLIHQRLATELAFCDLTHHVREILKQRSDWLRQVGFD